MLRIEGSNLLLSVTPPEESSPVGKKTHRFSEAQSSAGMDSRSVTSECIEESKLLLSITPPEDSPPAKKKTHRFPETQSSAGRDSQSVTSESPSFAIPPPSVQGFYPEPTLEGVQFWFLPVASRQSKSQLFDSRGYIYTHSKDGVGKNANKSFWRCRGSKGKTCRGRVILPRDVVSGQLGKYTPRDVECPPRTSAYQSAWARSGVRLKGGRGDGAYYIFPNFHLRISKRKACIDGYRM